MAIAGDLIQMVQMALYAWLPCGPLGRLRLDVLFSNKISIIIVDSFLKD